jgi:hypothetical protein
MSLDPELLPASVIVNLVRRGHSLEEMAAMSVDEAFAEWAASQGIDDPLRVSRALDAIRAAWKEPVSEAPVVAGRAWADALSRRE